MHGYWRYTFKSSSLASRLRVASPKTSHRWWLSSDHLSNRLLRRHQRFLEGRYHSRSSNDPNILIFRSRLSFRKGWATAGTDSCGTDAGAAAPRWLHSTGPMLGRRWTDWQPVKGNSGANQNKGTLEQSPKRPKWKRTSISDFSLFGSDFERYLASQQGATDTTSSNPKPSPSIKPSPFNFSAAGPYSAENSTKPTASKQFSLDEDDDSNIDFITLRKREEVDPATDNTADTTSSSSAAPEKKDEDHEIDSTTLGKHEKAPASATSFSSHAENKPQATLNHHKEDASSARDSSAEAASSSTTPKPSEFKPGEPKPFDLSKKRKIRPKASTSPNSNASSVEGKSDASATGMEKEDAASAPVQESKAPVKTLTADSVKPASPAKELDPRRSSSGLLGHYRNSDDELERLLTFMSDDSIVSKSGYRGKPSTKDRIKPSGERVIKEDLDIEDLLPLNIRNRYPGPESKKTKEAASDKPGSGKAEDKEPVSSAKLNDDIIADLDETLGIARKDRIRYDNEKFRQENAFNYSREVLAHKANPRTLENRNFFTPIYVDSFWSPSAASRKDLAKEYVLLTPAQKIIHTNYRPFKNEHSTQDLFTTLSELDKPEKYIKSIMRLEKKGWTIIGGGGSGGIIVFEREYNKRERWNWYLVKMTAGFVGVVGTIVVGLLATIEAPITVKRPLKGSSLKE